MRTKKSGSPTAAAPKVVTDMPDATLQMTGATVDEIWPLVRNHHYSKRRTADPMFCFAWRQPGGLFGHTGEPLAGIIYTAPVNRYFGTGAIELARLVRKPELAEPLSSFIAWSLRWLRANTDLRYCLSYADAGAGHHGGIYQACNFTYVRQTYGNRFYQNDQTGEIVSGRSFDQRRAAYKAGWRAFKTAPKYLYVFPLNEPHDELLDRFRWHAFPYPKPGRGDQ